MGELQPIDPGIPELTPQQRHSAGLTLAESALTLDATNDLRHVLAVAGLA